ncbi:hypothetical protein IHE45_20G064100 [Dioscorea alata]|uniref:Uncharacterized protein n=1 Tax=Dioscorea alata TaxID=55571 RepID=A0ACB7TUG7_DIOAL|nr:hypothetical protein IHE45_20G064100 [Dioscorea alata]
MDTVHKLYSSFFIEEHRHQPLFGGIISSFASSSGDFING